MVQAGFGHDDVVFRVIATNIVLFAAAIWSTWEPLWASFLALAAVVLLMVHFYLMTRD